MSGELNFGERVSYETLLLIWLDRVNKALQFPKQLRTGTTDLSIWIVSGIEAVKSLYYMLIPELREKVDDRLGKPLPQYLDYFIRYAEVEAPDLDTPILYKMIVYAPDLYREMKKKLEELENVYDKEEKEKIKSDYRAKTFGVLNKRIREAVKVIVDVLHESGLLLRERELYKGEA